ncbi:MAG: hypothetical protein QM528_07630 [Phycisphaerales bacterium]|nr:hypothetical protein [Phycisphaerales bacterium]
MKQKTTYLGARLNRSNLKKILGSSGQVQVLTCTKDSDCDIVCKGHGNHYCSAEPIQYPCYGCSGGIVCVYTSSALAVPGYCG